MFINKLWTKFDTFFTEWFLCHPFSFRLASNPFPDIGSVGRIEKKNHEKSRNRRPWYPGTTLKVNFHIIGLTKCTICCKKMFLFFSILLLWLFFRQIKRIIQSEKWFNYVINFFVFFENAKNLGRLEDAKRRKKGDGLKGAMSLN